MWYVVYTKKLADPKLAERLKKKNIEYYMPVQYVKKSTPDHTKTEIKEEYPLGRLIFIRTNEIIHDVIKNEYGNLFQYKDHIKNECATVEDDEMDTFRLFLSSNNDRVLFLKDPYSHFANKQKVRIREGVFAGKEGRIVRIMKSRKLVIELGTFAVAIFGVDPSILEPIDE